MNLSEIWPVRDNVEVSVAGEIVAPHVHVKVPAHQHGDVPVVCPQRRHKVQELLHVRGPVPQGGVVVPPMPRQSYWQSGTNQVQIDMEDPEVAAGSSIMP